MFEPKYTISDQIMNRLSEIVEIKVIVERFHLLPAKEVFLKQAAVAKIAHTSTSIEGNRLAEYQVVKLARGIKIQADSDQIKEVENYLRALYHIDKLAGSDKQFNETDILDIHKIIVNGLIDRKKTGTWRKGPVYIVNVLPKGEEQLAYTPPPSKYVAELIEDLLHWLNNNPHVHPVIRAGLFHYQFETIHPFTDGNGRTGRLLSLLHLYQSGWDFKKVLVLEDYYNRDRKKYFQSLQTGNTYKSRQGADLSVWLEYYVEGFLDEAKRVKDDILNLSVIPDTNSRRNILTNDELKIVDFVITIGKITSSDVADILRIPQRTAQAKLKKLEDMKVVEKHGAGPATYYSIPELS